METYEDANAGVVSNSFTTPEQDTEQHKASQPLTDLNAAGLTPAGAVTMAQADQTGVGGPAAGGVEAAQAVAATRANNVASAQEFARQEAQVGASAVGDTTQAAQTSNATLVPEGETASLNQPVAADPTAAPIPQSPVASEPTPAAQPPAGPPPSPDVADPAVQPTDVTTDVAGVTTNYFAPAPTQGDAPGGTPPSDQAPPASDAGANDGPPADTVADPVVNDAPTTSEASPAASEPASAPTAAQDAPTGDQAATTAETPSDAPTAQETANTAAPATDQPAASLDTEQVGTFTDADRAAYEDSVAPNQAPIGDPLAQADVVDLATEDAALATDAAPTGDVATDQATVDAMAGLPPANTDPAASGGTVDGMGFPTTSEQAVAPTSPEAAYEQGLADSDGEALVDANAPTEDAVATYPAANPPVPAATLEAQRDQKLEQTETELAGYDALVNLVGPRMAELFKANGYGTLELAQAAAREDRKKLEDIDGIGPVTVGKLFA